MAFLESSLSRESLRRPRLLTDVMADVYTPTKTLDGAYIVAEPTTPPAVYIPTRISPPADVSESTPMKEESTRHKYLSTVGDAYSPSNPGIRIVKRKPNNTQTTASTSQLGKRPAPEDGVDVAIEALKQVPKKGIIRMQPAEKRLNRRIFFSDTVGQPLVAIKEIEKITVHHSNYTDFRSSEKNEAVFSRHQMTNEWTVLPVAGRRVQKTSGLSVTGQREEKRIQELGIMRGAVFGTCELQDDPSLSAQALYDHQMSRPQGIPVDSVSSSDYNTLSTLRELPLPGRAAPPSFDPLRPPPSHQYHQYEPTEPVNNVYRATMGEPVIKQIFQDSEPVVANAYYATEDVKQSTAPKSPPSKIELPANLKEMLAQLKQKGFVSSEDTAPATTAAPLAAAMQTAQQMMGGGYVAEFATPDDERRQDSQNTDGWTQSGWKIQEQCSYFINRPNGCIKGDQCRFLHDEEMRRKTQAEHMQNGPPPRFHRNEHFNRRGGNNFRGGFRGHYQDRDFRRHDEPGYSGGNFKESQNQQNNTSEGYKPARRSRFDQRTDENPQDMDHRVPRRNRFDEQPPRQFRTRFDERPADSR